MFFHCPEPLRQKKKSLTWTLLAFGLWKEFFVFFFCKNRESWRRCSKLWTILESIVASSWKTSIFGLLTEFCLFGGHLSFSRNVFGTWEKTELLRGDLEFETLLAWLFGNQLDFCAYVECRLLCSCYHIFFLVFACACDITAFRILAFFDESRLGSPPGLVYKHCLA